MTWFKREDHEIINDSEKTVRTEGLWIKCDHCRKILWKADLEANLQVCMYCGKHFRIDARSRIEILMEPGFELVDLELKSTDPLNFCDLKPYKRRLAEAQKKTGLNDAIVNAIGQMGSHNVVLSVMEYGFIGGSMGSRGRGDHCPGDRPVAGDFESADHCRGFGRSEDDGRDRLADAVGENFEWACPAG